MVIAKQLNEIQRKKLDCIKIVKNDSDICDIQADIYGPESTPYHQGKFRCKLVLSSEFPRSAPKGFFLTKIYHPNVSSIGEICVNTLKKDWNPSQWNIANIFEVIKCLLIIPFPESSLNEEAGKQFMEDYQSYFKHAKLYTELYAMKAENEFHNAKREEQQQNQKIIQKQQNFQPVKENMQEQPKKKSFGYSPPKYENQMLENIQNKMEEDQPKKINSMPQKAQKIQISLTFSQPTYTQKLESQNISLINSSNSKIVQNSGKKEQDRKRWLRRI